MTSFSTAVLRVRDGCFLKWWYPKMDGLEWKTLFFMGDLGGKPIILGNPWMDWDIEIPARRRLIQHAAF